MTYFNSTIMSKLECLGAPNRWQANEKRLKDNCAARLASGQPKYSLSIMKLMELEKLEALSEPEPTTDIAIESSGSIPNAYYDADFLSYIPDAGYGEAPYLNLEHMQFDDTINGIVRSFHAHKTLEQEPQEALNLRLVYQLYRQLPCFNAALIMNEIGVGQSQAYNYLKLVRIANTLLTITTSKDMPIVPNYSDRDTRNYSKYKARNNGKHYSKKIWWLSTGRHAA